jgi:anti-anti-sigma factor
LQGENNVITETAPEVSVTAETRTEVSIVYATDYLNKLTGEKIERECREQLSGGCKTLVVNFRQTELVNSIGVSILLGVIDAANSAGAKVVFSDMNQNTVELFDMLGVSKHVELSGAN